MTGIVLHRCPAATSRQPHAHARAWCPHGHEFFRRGRMQSHRGIEIGLGRLHFDGDAEQLHHFGGAVADDVTADDAVGGGIDDQLHQNPRVAIGASTYRSIASLVFRNAGSEPVQFGSNGVHTSAAESLRTLSNGPKNN